MLKRTKNKSDVTGEVSTPTLELPSEQAALNLAEQAQHTVSTGEDLLVQTARLSVQADEREASHQLKIAEETVSRETVSDASVNLARDHTKAAKERRASA